ncbi:Mrp/NBP35 family ATP-binding protein [Roseospira marina]|uniref:Iron-sulfur cluster carrier protein n=1 Tax=Roseospira marina TaxID=140057 RepID=A0A5M6I8H9_9PROT|nr:Mrp/NBP35 family ATP-binding protein [Roseospira marina]KAA5604493.1 Mrp/NBP35 family ATP-binding protein [Roseospira marina]MBB4315545.1 ATP-binding protein involved in chromosome partitioning [Roseospira marina]MBB5088518.1 ATP-binding protein involved in chromosome partitioning [Roseospira marina]
MATPSRDDVIATLSRLSDPESGRDPVALGWVQGLAVQEGHVTVALEVPPERGAALEPLREAAEKAVHAMPGVLTATVVLTAPRAQGAQPGASGQPRQGTAGRAQSIAPPGVRHIIAVASGKGGVGKSTTAANLAMALVARGKRVGVFDADIYGPSMPRMFGLAGQRPMVADDRILPLDGPGLKVMSIGFMMNEEDPVVWRGPMVMGALEQMLRDVEWGELDVMVVDMPPGTGDTQLTMSQRVPLAGAVIVSTPQDIALLDARKGLNMFRRVDVPVFGIVENMSYYVCPNCGHREEVFAHGGAEAAASEMGCPFLGAIPLDIAIRRNADEGTPIVAAEPDSAHAQAYLAIADAVLAQLEGGSDAAHPAAPTIRFT